MAQPKPIILIIILAFIINACTSKEESITNQLQIADSYIKTQPQKSLQILDSINNNRLAKALTLHCFTHKKNTVATLPLKTTL